MTPSVPAITMMWAVCVSETGEVIASDDDSGGRYGFTLDADLQPGIYVLNVHHCCGGGGRYSVTASQK